MHDFEGNRIMIRLNLCIKIIIYVIYYLLFELFIISIFMLGWTQIPYALINDNF
jgi:hypothetical protein